MWCLPRPRVQFSLGIRPLVFPLQTCVSDVVDWDSTTKGDTWVLYRLAEHHIQGIGSSIDITQSLQSLSHTPHVGFTSDWFHLTKIIGTLWNVLADESRPEETSRYSHDPSHLTTNRAFIRTFPGHQPPQIIPRWQQRMGNQGMHSIFMISC